MFSRWYIHHFRDTCLLAEADGRMAGFMMGFLSQTVPEEAYIRIVMVDPAFRGRGIGRALYDQFFECAMIHGRTIVRCVTVPRKKDFIAFRLRLGFTLEPQEYEAEGIPVCLDYGGRGGSRVLLKKIFEAVVCLLMLRLPPEGKKIYNDTNTVERVEAMVH